MNQCPVRAIESAHGMAVAFWFIFTAVNTQIILIIINIFNILPDKCWWWIISKVISIAGMVLITAALYRIMHAAMSVKAIRSLVRFTSLTALPFWRRYNYAGGGKKKLPSEKDILTS